MTSKKISKNQSTNQLFKLLTKRSSYRRQRADKGVYNHWPTNQKPSLINCSSNYLKCLISSLPNETPSTFDDTKKSRNNSIRRAVPLSICTTLSLFPQAHLNFKKSIKFISSPNSKQINASKLNEVKTQISKKTPKTLLNIMFKKDQISPAAQQFNDEFSEVQLNSKQQLRLKFLNYERNFHQNKKRLNTSKIGGQRLKFQNEKNSSKSFTRQQKEKSRSLANNKSETNKDHARFYQNYPTFKSSNQKSMNTQQSSLLHYLNSPFRLKDYETNFQAFKVISLLIDEQMKWQPQRKRPKSSAVFRKYHPTKF